MFVYDAGHWELNIFFLGLFLPVVALLVFGGRLHKDPRPYSIALLAGAAIIQLLVIEPAATHVPLSTTWFTPALILTAACVLSMHFPRLLILGAWKQTGPKEQAAHAGEGAEAWAWVPRWWGLVQGVILRMAIGLATLLLPLLLAEAYFSWSTSLDRGVRLLPFFLVPSLVTVVVTAYRNRWYVQCISIVLISGAFGMVVYGHLTHASSSPLYYVYYGIILFVATVHSFTTITRNARQLRQMVSVEKQRREELNDLMLKAEAARVAKTQFVSSVSHELRTPLTAIRGYAQILQEELTGKIEPFHEESLVTIEQSCDRLTALVNDILDMAKVESGRIELTMTSVSLQSLIDEVVVQLYPLANDKGIILLRPRFDVVKPNVHADKLRLRQVLINLISNAIKFTEAGCVGIRVYASVIENYNSTLHAEPAYAIEVFDTGIGISPDFIERVFEPFLQEDRAYANTQRGTGLGLSITRELVVRMGGRIHVQSTLNEGTTFTVQVARALESRGDAKPSILRAPLPREDTRQGMNPGIGAAS